MTGGNRLVTRRANSSLASLMDLGLRERKVQRLAIFGRSNSVPEFSRRQVPSANRCQLLIYFLSFMMPMVTHLNGCHP